MVDDSSVEIHSIGGDVLATLDTSDLDINLGQVEVGHGTDQVILTG